MEFKYTVYQFNGADPKNGEERSFGYYTGNDAPTYACMHAAQLSASDEFKNISFYVRPAWETGIMAAYLNGQLIYPPAEH